MNFYKRNLPHWHPPGAEFFITFRLTNSLPRTAVEKLKSLQEILKNRNEKADKIQRAVFKQYEQLLDKPEFGPQWLSQNTVANIIADSIKYRDQKEYDLYCYCIMSNHVHLVIKMIEAAELRSRAANSLNQPTSLTKVLKELKRFTARESNIVLERSGQFWQHESYDRVIRNSKELERAIHYTLNNPVKAGLVMNWSEWPYSYCRADLINIFDK